MDSESKKSLDITALGEPLGPDPHFAHGFSRNPFYTGKSPSAYRWYRQNTRHLLNEPRGDHLDTPKHF